MTERFDDLDSTDVQIISLLREDGRMTARSLAQKVGIAEPTVATRIKNLYDNGQMKVVGMLSLDAAGRPIAANVGIRTLGRAVDEVAADLSAIDGVFSVMSVLGRYTLCVGVGAADLQDLRMILEKQMGKIKGIESMECVLSLETVKLSSLWSQFQTSTEPA